MLDARESGIAIAYIVAAVLFILGLKRLSSPATARSGNRLAAIGMALALSATLLDRQIVSFWIIAAGTLVGAGIGVYFARTVQMTAMPQMVALFNGMGGATAALVSVAEYLRISAASGAVGTGEATSIVLGTAIGAISFTGSLIAFGKLQELLSGKPLQFPLQRVLNTCSSGNHRARWSDSRRRRRNVGDLVAVRRRTRARRAVRSSNRRRRYAGCDIDPQLVDGTRGGVDWVRASQSDARCCRRACRSIRYPADSLDERSDESLSRERALWSVRRDE